MTQIKHKNYKNTQKQNNKNNQNIITRKLNIKKHWCKSLNSEEAYIIWYENVTN